jgi:carbon-monoxide dehydrogenase medium subunit
MIRPFSYFKPKSVEEALDALQAEGARVLAGGTDLLVEMRGGEKCPEKLVDIKGIKDLQQLRIDPQRGIEIGGCVSLNEIIDNAKVNEYLPILSEAAFSIATYQLRNRATLVGNICNASPAADMAPPLFVLGAEVVISGPRGERKLPVCDFFTGVKQTALEPGEMVLHVEIPGASEGKMGFLKKQRIKGHDLALINAAGLADKQRGILKICIGACAITPVLIPNTDSLFRDIEDLEELAERLAKLAEKFVAPIDDVRASREYRKDMVKVFVKRLTRKICSGV